MLAGGSVGVTATSVVGWIIDAMFDDDEVPRVDGHDGYPLRMTVRASDVAAEIRRRLPEVGVKKLHKLLYYCQGHHLAAFEVPIFHETVSAWDMGPVVGRLWWAEKDAGEVAEDAVLVDEAVLNTIGYVLSRYGRLSARDLEHMTHAEDPWRRANKQREPGGSQRIRNEWILDYFRSDTEDERYLGLDRHSLKAFVAGAEDRLLQPASADSLDGIRARAG